MSITAFTLLGQLVLGFEQSPITPLSTLLVAYILDLGLETIDAHATRRAPRYGKSWRSAFIFLLPAHIAALAVALLLYAGPTLWPYWLAVSVAITSKYMVKMPVPGGGWRHGLNPSNIGIVVVLLLFPWVGIAPPYQFTENVQNPLDWLIPLAILIAGTMLNAKLTGKGPLVAAWVIGFLVQAGLRAVFMDHSFAAGLMPVTGVAFVLFTNYMITDPGTTPIQVRAQVVFGITCAAWYGLLVASHISFGLFFALAATCLSRMALRYWMALPSLLPNRRTVRVLEPTP